MALGAAAIARTWQRLGVLAALVLLVIAASFLSHRFLTVPNLLNVLRQVSIVGILAIGMTFVILARGIDLSVGSILGIAVVLFAGSMDSRGMIVAIPLGMGAAALAGLVNGVGVAYGGLPPFIMTLGMLSFARGLAFIYTGGTPVPINNESFYAFGNGYFAGVPIPSLILIAALIVSGFVLQLTPFGRSVYAIGSNEEAARLSGVPVKVYTTAVYVISGFLSGLAGLVYASQLSIGTPIAGQGYELDAIAAVVVGGTSLFGGKGSVAGTFLGTLIIGVLANILNLTGVDPFVQQLFKGALIVVAVFIMSRTKIMSDAMSLEAALERSASPSGPARHIGARAKISLGARGHARAVNRRRRHARSRPEPAARGGRRFRHRAPSARSGFWRRRKSGHLHRRRGRREAVLGLRASRHDQLPCAAGSGRACSACSLLRASHA